MCIFPKHMDFKVDPFSNTKNKTVSDDIRSLKGVNTWSGFMRTET